MQACVFQKEILISKKEKSQQTSKEKQNRKYVHSVHGSVIRQSTFLELGHSPERCLAVPLNPVIGKNWDLISQQLKMVPATSSET
jgi:hypothetical protein